MSTAMGINSTHDPALRSWVESANGGRSDFPIQNLPFAVFYSPTEAAHADARVGVGIGDCILDLRRLQRCDALSGLAAQALQACQGATLNGLMQLGYAHWSSLRLALSQGLRSGATQQTLWQTCVVAQRDVQFLVPAQIGDYTDFYTSIHHASNVGRLLRPDNPLLPNYKWIPIGYHGRSSSIVVSGTDIVRPKSQLKPVADAPPQLGATQKLDYELELGAYIGMGNALGQPIAIDDWSAHIFGLCILNDWSARDAQAWEYQPLGPFLSKNFASSISPWVVTLEALAPFQCAWMRPATEPLPLGYLDSAQQRAEGALHIQLEVALQTPSMQASGQWHTLGAVDYAQAYWTLGQMLAHHSINGCNLRSGDLLGTGTQSGPLPSQTGALIELTHNGQNPVQLPSGETRTYLQDGDTVRMRACCTPEMGTNYVRIGFGEVIGRIRPALQYS